MFSQRFSRALTVVTVVSLVMASAALADTIEGDADFVTAEDQTTISVSGPAGTAFSRDVRLYIEYSGGNHVPVGTAVTFTGALQGACASTVPATSPAGAITIPSGWGTGSRVGPLTATITGTIGGAGTYSCNYRYAGSASQLNPGTVTFSISFTVVSDATPPAITPTVTGTAGTNGWYTSDVNVSWSVVDAQSTITSSSGCGPSTINTDTTGATLTCSATSAGGTASQSVTIKRDATAPTIGGAASPAPNGPGWNNTDVTVSFTCGDAISGIASCGPNQTLTTDGEGLSAAGTATDNAGNTASTTVSGIKIDQTPPSVTATAAPPAVDGWNSGAVTVTFAGEDALSAIASCDAPVTFSSETLAGSATGFCTDNAGNTASATASGINIDLNDPADASIIIDGGEDWTGSANVTLDLAATDTIGVTAYRVANGSDCSFATWIDVTSTTDFSLDVPDHGLAAGVDGTRTVCAEFRDAAGRSTTATDTIALDTTPPVIADEGVVAGTEGDNGWYTSAVTNQFSADDGAGIGLDADCQTAFPLGVREVTTSGEGSGLTVSSGPCADALGNSNPGISSAAFNIDLTNPTVSINSPATGTSTIAPTVTVSGAASDTQSGIASVSLNGAGDVYDPSTGMFSGPVSLSCGTNTIQAVATDVAGRTGSTSISVHRVCFGSLTYYQPLDQTTSTPVMNSGKNGRVIPVKVTARADGAALTNAVLTANGWQLQIGVNTASCLSGAATDSLEQYADAGSSNGGTNLFRWDSSAQQWIYNLDTKASPKAPSGTFSMASNTCYRLDVYVFDGTNKIKISDTTYALFKALK